MRLVFDLVPIGKGRPRFGRRGKFVMAYTPAATKKFESLIAKMAKEQMLYGQATAMVGPLSADLKMWMKRPKSLPKKSLNDYHTKKPDVDNITKGVLDALNGIAWHDDSQIAVLKATKVYGEKPRIEINIEQLPTCPTP